ncbi:hypothetical protein HDU97_010066 [Phlyctochytrium planicorne]|nr:hypothetical protein HDU97_010066 [Phlyctochytrium planicorne]
MAALRRTSNLLRNLTSSSHPTPPRMHSFLNEVYDASVVDTLHGVEIKDPFRVLEDPEHAKTKAFVQSQNQLSSEYLKKIPYVDSLKKKFTEMYNFERFGCPFKRGDSLFYFYNSGLLPQSILLEQKMGETEERVFLDPNTLSADGTTSLASIEFSKSGAKCAYGTSDSGSDWVTIRLKKDDDKSNSNVDVIEWAKFTGISWTHDESGFFYSRYPKPEQVTRDTAGTETSQSQNMMLMYHKIGTAQAEDVLIYQDIKNPEYLFGSEVSDDGQYLIMTISRSCDPENLVYISELPKTASMKTEKVVDSWIAEFSYITNYGSVFYFLTTLNAPKRRLVRRDISRSDSTFEEVVKEEEDVIEFGYLADTNKLILVYLKDVKHVLKVIEITTGETLPVDLPLPVGSIIQGMSAKKEDSVVYYKYGSFSSPGTTIKFDFASKKSEIYKTTQLPDYNADDIVTKQVFYESKDGTKIPMFIIHSKSHDFSKTSPTLLYAYGGFNISIRPAFRLTWICFVKYFKGIVAVANIRGGGEYGQDWYDGGRLFKKQNCFTDFQYSARYLIANKYTSSSQLAINGESNGGLLVAACTNQAPELYRAAIADVGVMDVLRFHKFTIGSAWVSDFGDPEKKEDFENILKFSPLHNVRKDVKYPAVLLLTSDHDDRVVPLHSLKLIATLQREAKSDYPIIIRIETKAGHGAGKSTQQQIEEAVDKIAFISYILECEVCL